MGIKNVVVIVDDFSSAYLQLLDAGYNIETYDYGNITTNLIATDINGNITFDFGVFTDGLTLPLYTFTPDGLFSAWDENLNYNPYDDGVQAPLYLGPDPDYPADDLFAIVQDSAPLDPFHTGFWEHGDVVAKAFFDHLDHPEDTYVLGIDWDYTDNQDYDDLFVDLDGTGQTEFEKLIAEYLDIKAEYWPENEYNLVGYSFSWGWADNSHLTDDLLPLWDVDTPIFTFAEPNVGQSGQAWNDVFPDIIAGGAWNMSLDGYSDIAAWDHIDEVDLLANGIVEHGSDSNLLTGSLGFGTSYATPRIMAEVVNFYEAYIYPLLDSGYSSIAEVWGSIVDPSEGYSGIVDYIIDAISTEVDVLFEGQSEYKTFNVLNDDLEADGDLPTAGWWETNGQGEYTPRIIDVVVKSGDQELAIVDYTIETNTRPYQDDVLFAFDVNVQLNNFAGVDQITTNVEIQSNYLVNEEGNEGQGDYITFNVPITLTSQGSGSFTGTAEAPAALFDSIPNPDNVGSYGIMLGGTNAIKSDGSSSHVYIDGDSPNEVLYIGNNDDNLIGWSLETLPSTVAGGDGNDVLFGGINDSEIDGGPGNDAIYPGKGVNLVYGGSGNDIILPGIGGGFFEGGSGDDTFFVGQGGALTNVDPNNTLSGAAIVLGFGEAVLGDGNNVAVLSVAKKFETPINAHPNLQGSGIGDMAWGEFSVTINGLEQIVGISPDLFSMGQLTPTFFGSIDGVSIIAVAMPSALNQNWIPSDPNTHVVDLYIQAMDDQGNAVPLPAGTQISVTDAKVGELGFDATGQPALINPTSVDMPAEFPDTFYTAQVLDEGLVYDDGTRLKMYYVNDDRNQVTYEIENEHFEFMGDDGQDTIRFTVPQGEFTQAQHPSGGVTYTHTESGNTFLVHQSVENVIFDGWSGIVDPTLFANDIAYSVPGMDGSAFLSVSGIADVSKLDPNATEFYVVFEGRVWYGSGVGLREFKVPIQVSDLSPDGSFYLNHLEPQILQGPVTLKGILFEDATGEKYQSLQMVSVFGSEDPISQSQIQVEQLDIIFDSESGKPSIVAKGIVEYPEYFLSGMVGVSIEGALIQTLVIHPDFIAGDTGQFSVVIEPDYLDPILKEIVDNHGGGNVPHQIQISVTSTEVVDISKAPNYLSFDNGPSVDVNLAQAGDVPINDNSTIIIGSDEDDAFSLDWLTQNGDAVSDVTLASGDGDDRLMSTIGDDTVYAGAGDDYITATDGQDVIFAGSGNDIYRVTNLPSQVDISQGVKMVDMSAAINTAGMVIVGASFIGPDSDAEHELNLAITLSDNTGSEFDGMTLSTGPVTGNVAMLPLMLSDGTQLIAVLTETSRLAGKDAAEGLAAYSVLILNGSGEGDIPAGIEFDFAGTSINGSNLDGPTGPLVVPAADDPVLEEIKAKNLWSYEGEDAVYDAHSSEFDGGSGYDTVYFYGSSDEFTILEENGRVTVTHIASSRTDVLHRVEKLLFIDGSAVEEVLFDPFADYQKIDGGDGDDILVGGAGKSYITSGGGSDIIRDEGGEDYVLLTGASGTVDIDLGIDDDVIRIGGDFTGNVALSGGAGNDVLEIEGGFSGLEREGNDLKITLADGSVITIANQFDDFGNVHGLYGIGLIKNVTVAEDGSETSTGIALDPYFGDQADFTQIILTEDSPFINVPWDQNRLDPLNIIGSSASDMVESGSGDDLIIGNDGHDFIHGNSGDDEIHGGVGDDVLIGGIGADKIFGGTGDDLIVIDFFKNGFFSETEINEWDSPTAWAPGGLDVVQDAEGVDTLMLDGSLMGDPLGSAYYELIDGTLTISASVSDVYDNLAITEMVSDQWFRLEPAGYDIEDGEPNFGMTTEEVLALDIYDIETWPGFFDLDVASQEFYRAYFDPSLDSAELLARLNDAASHVYDHVNYNNRYHTPPVADSGNYPLYLSEEHANGAMEGDGTSHPMNVNGMTYWMPNGVENHFHGDLPPDYDFESDNYGVWTVEGYLPSAPTSGDPSGTYQDQMPFLFTTALAYGNVIDISGEYGDAMQGVVVEDASQIEIILEASDELAWDVLDAKLFEIMSGGGEPDEIRVGPEQWLNAAWTKNEVTKGIYSGSYMHAFTVEQVGDEIQLVLNLGPGYVFWKGPVGSVTHFDMTNGSIAVSDWIDLPSSGGMSAAEAAAELIPWAVEEGYMKEYYLDPDGIATGSDQDHLLIGDWSKWGEQPLDNIPGLDEVTMAAAGIPSYYVSLEGGSGDDKLVAASLSEFELDFTDSMSLAETFQVMQGGEGDDTFVIKDAAITVALGGEGIDKFYVGENWVQTVIFADGIDPNGGFTGLNSDFGDAVFFDAEFSQDNVTRLGDGGILVSFGGAELLGANQTIVYDAEYLFFRDENGEYERIATTFGEVITSAMWSDSDLASNFDNLDPSLFTFSVDFDTYVNGIQTDKLILNYDGEEVWSGDRWSVDKFELPQDTYVNVVNVREEDALTGEVFDPNSFTTEGIDLIFGDDNVNIINAKGGNDIIFAGGGDDVIIGGDGDDLIFGEDGDDILRGDGLLEDDIAESYFSDDYFIEGSPLGDDIIEGGEGRDDLAAGDGSDALAADSFDNIDLDGDGLTSDTLSDIAGFNPFDEPEDIV